jgi:hypothetical protein
MAEFLQLALWNANSLIQNTEELKTYLSIKDLETPTVKEEIHHYSSQYNLRFGAHSNDLIVKLVELPDRRLQKHLPNDLLTRLLVQLLYL